MTWSPRNRTGEEDEDDFSDAGEDENLTVDESDGMPEGQTTVESGIVARRNQLLNSFLTPLSLVCRR